MPNTSPPTPYMAALDAFKQSKEWKQATDPKGLGVSEDLRRFLENRVELAFREGWVRCGKAIEISTMESFRKATRRGK